MCSVAQIGKLHPLKLTCDLLDTLYNAMEFKVSDLESVRKEGQRDGDAFG